MEEFNKLRKNDIETTKIWVDRINTVLKIPLNLEDALGVVLPKIIGSVDDRDRCFSFTQSKHGMPRCCQKLPCPDEDDTLYCSRHSLSLTKMGKDPTKFQIIPMNIKARDLEILYILIDYLDLEKKPTKEKLMKHVYFPKCSYTEEGSHQAGIQEKKCESYYLCYRHKGMVNNININQSKNSPKKRLSFSINEDMVFDDTHERVYPCEDDDGNKIFRNAVGEKVTYSGITIKKSV